MLYLGIDQHARQLTISLRDDSGDVLQARQGSTRPEKIHTFFTKLTRECVRDGESFIAVVEVCGFNDWLFLLVDHHRQADTGRRWRDNQAAEPRQSLPRFRADNTGHSPPGPRHNTAERPAVHRSHRRRISPHQQQKESQLPAQKET